MIEKMIKNTFLGILTLGILASCNVAQNEQLSEKAREATTGISENSFSYSAENLTIIQNTTFVNIAPKGVFSNTSFSVSPTLPTGLTLRSSTGEITGVATDVITPNTYTITASSGTSQKYAGIYISITQEPPKTFAFAFSNLSMKKGIYSSFIPIITGGLPTSITSVDPLPFGLSLNPTTGQISGIPVSSGSYPVELIAMNSTGSVSTSLNIIIADSVPSGLTYSNTAQDINVSDALTTMSPTLSSLSDSVTYMISPSLPLGLTLDASTGEITGTPTSSNSIVNYTVTAYNDSGNTTELITLNVKNPPRTLTYPVSTIELQFGVQIPKVKLTQYEGGSPVSYSCVGCPAGITVNSNTGLISGATTEAIRASYAANIIASHTVRDINGVSSVKTLSTPITFNVVDNYPEGNTLGFASTYKLYKDTAIVSGSIIPKEVEGSSNSYAITPAISSAPGLAFNSATGEISGTPTALTGVTPLVFTITGFNDDNIGVGNKETKQDITIVVSLLSPVMLGYNSGGAPSFYNSTTKVYEFVDGVLQTMNPCFEDVILEPDCIGGHPTAYYITPQLPTGLSLNATTGVISGSPSEMTPARYYTIRAQNDSGSYSQTIAISTDANIAPMNLVYNDDDTDCTTIPVSGNIINGTLGTPISEVPCYTGSQSSFGVSPSLPSGLTLNSTTGEISGTPLESNDTGVNDSYTITATNGLGSTSTTITLSLADLKAPSNLSYTNAISITQGDNLSSLYITHSSDYDSNPNLGGFISTYTLGAGTHSFVLGTTEYTDQTMVFDSLTGKFSGIATATNPGDLTPSGVTMPITPSNSFGVGTVENFTLIVKEKPPVISYDDVGYGENQILIQGGVAQVFSVTNSAGAVATINAGAGGCSISEASFKDQANHYDVTSGNFTFNAQTCEISFNGSQCFNDDPDANGFTGDTIVFDILAKNSGAPTGVNSQLTAYFYDKPNFTFQPDVNFPSSTLIVLDGSQSIDSYGPTLNSCHGGTFTLSDSSQLPIPFTFDTATGTITSNQESILGRLSFDLTAQESNSGHSFSQTQSIELQANYIESNSSDSDHQFETTMFDLNLDGQEDVILRSKKCDDEACGVEDGNLILFIQDSVTPGLLYGTGNTLPVISNVKAKAVTAMKYDTSKAGIAYINNTGSQIMTRSTTDTEADSVAFVAADTAGELQGIAPMESDSTENFAVIARDNANSAIDIFQFTITGNDMSNVATATTAKINMLDHANGGADVDSIDYITHQDISGSGKNTVFVGYTDGANTRICLIDSIATNFQSTCSAKIDIPNNGTVRDINFADITGDSLEDLVVLVNNGVTNTIYVFENKYSTLPALFSYMDTIELATSLTGVRFDLADLNNDNQIDIITNDLSSGGTLIDGNSIYYHTGSNSNLYIPSLSTPYEQSLSYSNYTGSTHEVQLIKNTTGSSTKNLLFNCQHEIATDNQSSCGIIGSF